MFFLPSYYHPSHCPGRRTTSQSFPLFFVILFLIKLILSCWHFLFSQKDGTGSFEKQKKAKISSPFCFAPDLTAYICRCRYSMKRQKRWRTVKMHIVLNGSIKRLWFTLHLVLRLVLSLFSCMCANLNITGIILRLGEFPVSQISYLPVCAFKIVIR